MATPQEIAAGQALYVQSRLDAAWALAEEQAEFLERRRATREELRSMVASKVLTDEQAAEVEELFPAREHEPKTPEQRAAKLEAQAKAVRAKAAEKAKAKPPAVAAAA